MRARFLGAAAAAAVVLFGTGCAGTGVMLVHQKEPTLRQLSVPELERFAPGSIDVTKSVDPRGGAPLLCGGTRPSRLAGAAVVKMPNSSSRIAVLRYSFASRGDASSFLMALHKQAAALIQSAQCRPEAANGGDLVVQVFIGFAYESIDAWAETTESPPQEKDFSVFRYVQNDSVVYLIRVDTRHDDASNDFVDGLENTMTTGPGPRLHEGGHSARPSRVSGVLQRGEYNSTEPSEDENCPEVVIGGTAYTLALENQLTNGRPNGVLVSSPTGRVTTIPWGARVHVLVDTFESAVNGCRRSVGNGAAPFVHALSISPAS